MYWFGLMFESFLTSIGGAQSETKRQKGRPSPLTKGDEILYAKIVDDLLHSNSTSFVFVFRQSASWKTVQDQLLFVKNRQWKTKWEQVISDLNGLQQKVHRCGDRILKAGHEDPEVITLRNEIVNTQLDIALILQAAEKNLAADCANPNLKSDPTIRPVLDHLKNYWPYLIVFRDWVEVKMDSDAMWVQVHDLSDQRLVTVNQLSPETKGAFWIKQGENPSAQENPTPMDETHWPCHDLSRQCSDTLILDEKNDMIGDKAEPEIDPRLMKTIPKSVQGDRLQRIVQQALEKVNDIKASQ